MRAVRIFLAWLLLTVIAAPAAAQFIGLQRTYPPLVTPQLPTGVGFAALGDSITDNYGALVQAYPNLYAGSTVTFTNLGVPGEICAGMQVTQLPQAQTWINTHSSVTTAYASILIGANDYGAETATPAQLISCITSSVASLRSFGFAKVFVATLTSQNPNTGYGISWITTTDPLIRALYPSVVDGIIDFSYLASCGPINNGFDLAQTKDGLHPTQLCHYSMERVFADVLNQIAAGNVAPGVPSGITQGPVTDTTMVLNWTGPVCSASCGGYYSDTNVQYQPHGSLVCNYCNTTSVGSRNTSITLTGLTANTAYDVRIQTTGPGGSSQAVYFTTGATLASLPDTLDPNSIYLGAPAALFSGGNLIATSQINGNVSATVRSFVGKSSGKWYFEFLINASAVTPALGICDNSFYPLPDWQFSGSFPNSAGMAGTTLVDGFTVVNAAGLATNPGDYIMFAFDAGAQKAWVGRNGTWNASGNPATGANPWVTWSTSYTLYACFSFGYAGQGLTYSGSTTHFTPPTGFLPL